MLSNYTYTELRTMKRESDKLHDEAWRERRFEDALRHSKAGCEIQEAINANTEPVENKLVALNEN